METSILAWEGKRALLLLQNIGANPQVIHLNYRLAPRNITTIGYHLINSMGQFIDAVSIAQRRLKEATQASKPGAIDSGFWFLPA